MPKNTKPIPEGYHTLTPALSVRDVAKAIEFYKKAFGAVEHVSMPGPEYPEGVQHPCRAPRTLKATTFSSYLYVQDADAAFARAVKAGAEVIMPLSDMFWGDRCGQVQDPEGHLWFLATHKEDLTPEQMAKRRDAYFAAMK